jgi:general secretion pathway protein J
LHPKADKPAVAVTNIMQSPGHCFYGRPQGFTLIEILLAIFIFAIVISALYGSYSGTFQVIDKVEKQATAYRQARIAMARITEDLESSYYSELVTDREPFVGTEGELQGMRADTLRFISKAHLVFNDEDLAAGKAQILYDVREGESGEGLALYRHDIPELAPGSAEESEGLLLCDNLVEVRFSYFDSTGNEQSSWDATDTGFAGKTARERIPRMVAITLRFRNASQPQAPYTFMTSVILPISRES